MPAAPVFQGPAALFEVKSLLRRKNSCSKNQGSCYEANQAPRRRRRGLSSKIATEMFFWRCDDSFTTARVPARSLTAGSGRSVVDTRHLMQKHPA
jgi:hypothetical protein